MSDESRKAKVSEQVELIADYACETGEGPLWHPIENRLYWTDIPRGRMFRFDPVSRRHEQFYEGRPVGGFTIQSDGSLLLFMDCGTIAVWREGTLIEIVPHIPSELDSRFNDVIADPRGRVFCGTMSSDGHKGRLYRLELDGSLHLVLEEIGCPNGMAFAADGKGFYFTDSFAREIYHFDYSVEDGRLSNQRVFARFGDELGLPDGATLDSEGRLWTALWDGGAVVRLGLGGEIESVVAVPTRKASSLTFGGSDYKDMYITTAGGNIRDVDGQFAGALFRKRCDVSGRPEFFSQVVVSAHRNHQE
jgi:sugar lactone lactonase YvrE